MKSTITTSNKVAEILLDIGAVLFSRNKPFKFDSGILSPVYVDTRVIISYPKERKFVIDQMVKKIKEIGIPDVIGGIATAGIPHAAWIAQELNLPMIFIREQPKDHGRGKQVEGVLKRGQKVLIIEELISTGGTSVNIIAAVRKLGGKVTDEISIYTHNLKESVENFKHAEVKLHYLTDTKEVAQVAKTKGYLKQKQIEIVAEWTKNPKNWGKKMGFD